MHILSINKTNSEYNKSFGMANAMKNSAARNKSATVVSKIVTSRPEKSNLNITIEMDKLYAYAKFIGQKDSALLLKSKDTTEVELELINPFDLYQKMKKEKNKDTLIDDVFKVKWDINNVEILKEIDKTIKLSGYKKLRDKSSSKISQEWYGTPEEIFEKALKENMHYLVLLDDVKTLNKKCNQKLLLDFINNNDWSDANKHYLSKIANLHIKLGIEDIWNPVWDGKTLFEKALADKNIYLLELESKFGNKYTPKADILLSEIEDEKLREKFIKKSNVIFNGVIFDIPECKTEEELVNNIKKYSNQFNSRFWQRDYHGRLLFDRILHIPNLKRNMYETFIINLSKYLPKYALLGMDDSISIMDMRLLKLLKTSLPDEIFQKVLGEGELNEDENILVWEKARELKQAFTNNELKKLRAFKILNEYE